MGEPPGPAFGRPDDKLRDVNQLSFAKMMGFAKAQPYSLSSSATGSRERAPDDRLRRTIQYAAAFVMISKGRGVLDAPHARGMTASRGASACPSGESV
jgi:hypothetical protein